MKKILIILITIPLIFGSCEKEDDSPDSNSNSGNNPIISTGTTGYYVDEDTDDLFKTTDGGLTFTTVNSNLSWSPSSIEFVDCSGKITSVAIKFDLLQEMQKKRFNFVTLTYTGTPVVTVKVDSVEKISSTTLVSPGSGNTGTAILYFPAMTEGHIPHIIADETETSRVSGSVFDAEVI